MGQLIMRHASASLVCLAATLAVGFGCTRSGCVSESEVVTERGIVATCVTAEDAGITTELRERLRVEFADAADTMRVSTAAAAVTLTGTTFDEWHKKRAEKLAYAMDAVERVENKIVVMEPPTNPRALSTPDRR